MQMYIPRLGERIMLTAPWTFEVEEETRNTSITDALAAFGEEPTWELVDEERDWVRPIPVYTLTLPAKTVLQIERIYIRRGQEDFDSVTFRIEDTADPRFLPKSKRGAITGKPRFWVRLEDANRIEFGRMTD